MKILFYGLLSISFLAAISSALTPIPQEKPKPTVILHFDVNRTILADDPAGGKTLHDVLVHSLADFYKDRWIPSLEKPLSYSEYIKQHVLPGPTTDKELKKLRNTVVTHKHPQRSVQIA
jgi:hypothetical protein